MRHDFYGTGIADKRAARRYLRRKFGSAPLPEVAPSCGRRFYVTAQHGAKVAYVAGPYASHMTALAAVPTVRAEARKCYGTQVSFVAFGTASRPDVVATKLGRMRPY